jgi:ABC-type multidrug transport system fused ATPase/permease subunit
MFTHNTSPCSGKSTLALVLMRLVEPVEGIVRIDGLDTARVSLYQLRSRFAVIPQVRVRRATWLM